MNRQSVSPRHVLHYAAEPKYSRHHTILNTVNLLLEWDNPRDPIWKNYSAFSALQYSAVQWQSIQFSDELWTNLLPAPNGFGQLGETHILVELSSILNVWEGTLISCSNFQTSKTDTRAVGQRGSTANSFRTSGYSSCSPSGRMLHLWCTITVSIYRLNLAAALHHDGFAFTQVAVVEANGKGL